MAKAKLNQPITLAGVTVPPGERTIIDLEVAQLYTHSPLGTPIEVVNGKYAGPVLLVSAAIHGDELNGVEAVRQLLNQIKPERLKGVLIAVPVVNVFGFVHKSRYLPDRRDLNRCFPGSERGSIASRLAYQFLNQVVKHCTHIIDLHTGALHRSNLPQIRANLANPATDEMVRAFAAPVIIDAELRDGSLRAVAESLDIPTITYEGGEALRFDSLAIGAAVNGILGVMRELGMIRKTRRKGLINPVIARSTSWVRANENGIVRSQVQLGDSVTKGQILAYVSAPLGLNEGTIEAPKSGVVIGQLTLPLVNEGDAVFNLAYFEEEDEHVVEQVGHLIDEVNEGLGDEALRIGIPSRPYDEM
ncbi:MAG: deacylase [Oceanospirillales bacterium]|nr:deacylase [Oceanospirillales bacterium]